MRRQRLQCAGVAANLTLANSMQTSNAGSLLPLFDRLSGAAAEREDGHLLTASGLRQSIQHDLLRLFNVRNAVSIDHFLAGSPTALDYGLPDTLGLSPQSATDLQRWELVLARAIALYEPRLRNAVVRVRPDGSRPSAARVSIGAQASLGNQLCQVHFEVVLDKQAARP